MVMHGWRVTNRTVGAWTILHRFGRLRLALVLTVALLVLTKRYVYWDMSIDTVHSCEVYGWHDAPVGRRVYDAVPINSELDILLARLNELDSVVDIFVIVEAPYTFSGKPKRLFFNENRKMFARFLPRIRYVVLDDFEPPPGVTDLGRLATLRKAHAKTGIVFGLSDAQPNDLVIVSDLDEIPRATVIDQLKNCDGFVTPVELHLVPFIYDFGCVETTNPQWRRAKIVYRREIDDKCDGFWDGKCCTDELRDNQHIRLGLFRFPTSVARSGWHISYFMSLEKIQEKIGSYAHVERDTEANRNLDNIKCHIHQCRHINGKDYGLRPRHKTTGLAWTYTEALRGNPVFVQFYNRTLHPGTC